MLLSSSQETLQKNWSFLFRNMRIWSHLLKKSLMENFFLCSKVSQSETYLEPCHTSTMECLTKSKLVYFFLKKFNQKYLTRSTAFLMLINLSCSYFISLLFTECFKIFLSSTKLQFSGFITA